MSHVGDDPDAPVLPKFYAQHAEKGVINVGGHMGHFTKLMEAAKIDNPVARESTGSRGRTTRERASMLRHFFNSELANSSIPQEIRMQLTGHKSTEINDIYTHLDMESRRVAVNSLPSIPGLKYGAKFPEDLSSVLISVAKATAQKGENNITRG